MTKCFSTFIMTLAVLVATLACVLPKTQLFYLGYISHFFELMLPFLAVGALVKYLMSGMDCKRSCS